MHNTNETNAFTFQINRGTLPRMQRRNSFSTELNFRQFTGKFQYSFQIAFQIVIINAVFTEIPVLFIAVAADSARQHQILTDTQVRLSVRHKAQTGFENAHAALLTVLVVDDGSQQAGQQRQAHRGHLAGYWAWQDQCFLARVDQLLHFRVNEAVGDHFLVTFVVQHGFHTLQREVGFTVGAHHQASLHRLIRNVVVAVNAGHLFHQIFFDLHIETPAWRNGCPLVLAFGYFTAQTTQNVAHLRIGNVVANQAIQFAAAQGDGRRLRQMRLAGHVNNRTGFATADVDQQAGSALHRFVLQRRIDAALIAVRSVGMQAVTTCATGNGERAEEGAFQQHVLGFIVHAGVVAAKDPAHRQRLAMVGNHQRVGIEFGFAAVEQNQGLALFRHTNHNAAFNAIFIERVHWLTQLQQNVVGHINHGIDGADAAAAQLLFHPQRSRCLHVNAFNHTAKVARTGLWCVNLNRYRIVDGGSNRCNLWHVQFGLVQHSDVARNADNA